MINILDLLGIGDAIVQALRTFVCWIAAGIYTLIENVYHIFELLGRAEIVENEFIQQIYSKVGMILGIFMVFKLVFSLIQSLVDPNKLNDKKDGFGQIILRIIIAIALLGLTPTIFREAYNIQNLLVGRDSKNSDNILYKLIAGSNTNGNIGTIGRTLSGELYFGFYTDNEDPKLNRGMIDTIYNNNQNSSEYKDRFQEDNYDTLKNNVISGNRGFYATLDYVAIKDKNEYVIEVNWIPLLFVGIFVLYIIAVYCIQVGIRVVQLAYLQLIAPIPILSYISDPEGSFKKWTKQCITTYLDLFIRLAIIYFVMSLISDILAAISESKGILYESTNLAAEPWIVQWLVVAIIIIGLLMFAKKVPDLLKDLFPNLGGGAASLGFGLGPKKVMEQFKNLPLLSSGAKAIGYMGKKAIGYADRKIHHIPRSRGKFGQFVDKLAPGHAEAVKNRRQAKIDNKEFEKQQEDGQNMYTRFGESLLDKNNKIKKHVFSSEEYGETFEAVALAKSELKKSSSEVANAQAELNAAYSYNGSDKNEVVEIAKKKYDNAIKNQKSAEGKLELANKRHDNNKKIYTEDAKREQNYKAYTSTHQKQIDINSGIDEIKNSYKKERESIQMEINRREQEAKQREKRANTAQEYYEKLNGIPEGRGPKFDPEKSAIFEKYRQEDEQIQLEINRREQEPKQREKRANTAQEYYEKLNSVPEGRGPKINQENSILYKLDQDARQEEYKNRKIDKQ